MWSVNVDGAAELTIQLGARNKAIVQGVRRQVQISTLSIHRRARQKLRDEKAVDTGRALSSISWIRVGLDGLVSVDAEHGKYIEFGTAPHFPPPSALAGWARRHGMAGMEYVIARKIARDGTPARPFLHPAYQEEIPIFRAAVAVAIIRGATAAG